MPDFRGHKLGRLDNPPGVHTAPLLMHMTRGASLPAPPVAAGYGLRITDWAMLANDTVGDCYPAAMMHALRSATTWAGTAFMPTDDLTLRLYSEITGYNPADPNTDLGTAPADAIRFWQTRGIDLGNGSRDILQGAAGLRGGVDGWTDLQRAVAWGSMALVSWQLPMSAQTQDVWDVVEDDGGVWGGHETLAIFYNQDACRLVTWGVEQPATAAFVRKYMTGGVMPITRDALSRNGVDPAGLDWTQIETAKAAFSAAVG